jgi:hypothetical protein
MCNVCELVVLVIAVDIVKDGFWLGKLGHDNQRPLAFPLGIVTPSLEMAAPAAAAQLSVAESDAKLVKFHQSYGMQWYPLQGNGLISNLLHHLAKPVPVIVGSEAADVRCRVNIPDSVIFEHNEPHAWYFTSGTGEMMRKLSQRLHNDVVYTSFKRTAGDGAPPSLSRFMEALPTRNKARDICAVFMSEQTLGVGSPVTSGQFSPPASNCLPLMFTELCDAHAGQREVGRDKRICVEYLTAGDLRTCVFGSCSVVILALYRVSLRIDHLLYHRTKPNGSVLQRFTLPHSPSHSGSCTSCRVRTFRRQFHASMSSGVLKISYMNGLISVQRRTNINRLGDDTIDVYERLVTYEGPPHHSISETVIVGSLLSQSSDLIDGIVRHVGLASDSAFEITKIVVYAKV